MATSRDKNGFVTVQSGDSLWKIARDNGICYWRNLYYAGKNASFRTKRPDPNKIFPGDQVYVPTLKEVEPMEKKPSHKYAQVPLYTQSKLETCWRAAGKMVYAWRFPVAAERTFNTRIGKKYQTQETFLRGAEFSVFYKQKLHMQTANIGKTHWFHFNALHVTLALEGPVIMAMDVPKDPVDHAVVVIGYNLLQGVWYYIDPFVFVQKIEFSPLDVMNPSTAPQTATESLVPGAATPANMVRTVAIADGKLRGIAAWYPR